MGGVWKNHKYIRKEGKRYIYEVGNTQYDSRRDAERRATDDNLWYGDGKAYTERAEQLKKYYRGFDKNNAEIYKSVNGLVNAQQNKQFGAGGMPSNVANKVEKNSNEKVDQSIKNVEANRQAELKERYQKKGMGGMPSSVIKAMTKRIKDI